MNFNFESNSKNRTTKKVPNLNFHNLSTPENEPDNLDELDVFAKNNENPNKNTSNNGNNDLSGFYFTLSTDNRNTAEKSGGEDYFVFKSFYSYKMHLLTKIGNCDTNDILRNFRNEIQKRKSQTLLENTIDEPKEKTKSQKKQMYNPSADDLENLENSYKNFENSLKNKKLENPFKINENNENIYKNNENIYKNNENIYKNNENIYKNNENLNENNRIPDEYNSIFAKKKNYENIIVDNDEDDFFFEKSKKKNNIPNENLDVLDNENVSGEEEELDYGENYKKINNVNFNSKTSEGYLSGDKEKQFGSFHYQNVSNKYKGQFNYGNIEGKEEFNKENKKNNMNDYDSFAEKQKKYKENNFDLNNKSNINSKYIKYEDFGIDNDDNFIKSDNYNDNFNNNNFLKSDENNKKFTSNSSKNSKKFNSNNSKTNENQTKFNSKNSNKFNSNSTEEKLEFIDNTFSSLFNTEKDFENFIENLKKTSFLNINEKLIPGKLFHSENFLLFQNSLNEFTNFEIKIFIEKLKKTEILNFKNEKIFMFKVDFLNENSKSNENCKILVFLAEQNENSLISLQGIIANFNLKFDIVNFNSQKSVKNEEKVESNKIIEKTEKNEKNNAKEKIENNEIFEDNQKEFFFDNKKNVNNNFESYKDKTNFSLENNNTNSNFYQENINNINNNNMNNNNMNNNKMNNNNNNIYSSNSNNNNNIKNNNDNNSNFNSRALKNDNSIEKNTRTTSEINLNTLENKENFYQNNSNFNEKTKSNPNIVEKTSIKEEIKENLNNFPVLQKKLNECVSFLQKPFVCLKYGLKTWFKPAKRALEFSSNLENFWWKNVTKKNDNGSNIKKFFLSQDITGVQDGRITPNFRRFKTKNPSKLKASFSILLKKRSIDIECLSFEEKENYFNSLVFWLELRKNYLIENNKIISNKN